MKSENKLKENKHNDGDTGEKKYILVLHKITLIYTYRWLFIYMYLPCLPDNWP